MIDYIVVSYCPAVLLQHFSSPNTSPPHPSARAGSCSQHLEIRRTAERGEGESYQTVKMTPLLPGKRGATSFDGVMKVALGSQGGKDRCEETIQVFLGVGPRSNLLHSHSLVL